LGEGGDNYMDRFFGEEFKEEIETAYRTLLKTKRDDLTKLEEENKKKREELATLFVNYQQALYNNNETGAKEIDEEHTRKWDEYSTYESHYLSEKSYLEKLINRILSKYPDK
jgi:seryl-tRNA synthetase